MPTSASNLEELIALRKRERAEEQRAHTQEVARTLDAALGTRVVEAIDPQGQVGWEINNATALRRFHHRCGELHLLVTAIHGASRVDVELRHIDSRFGSLARKAGLAEVGEDWFLNAVEALATQVLDRMASPRNFT